MAAAGVSLYRRTLGSGQPARAVTGHTPPSGSPLQAGCLSDNAVEHELDVLGVADFHVAGYSLGGRVALELASRGRVRSIVAIAPDGLGTPPERIYHATALLTGRALATPLAPVAAPLAASRVGRSLFFAMERSQSAIPP